jgi:anaerobic magnesium-protoporphyrin IX monomethyl ester cyclase
MGSDIILIQAPRKINWFLQGLGWVYPHLALPYLAAVLEREGYTVRIIDAPMENLNAEQVADIVTTEQPLLVGFTAHTAEYSSAKKTAQEIKAKCRVPIVLGGVHAQFLYDEILKESSCPFDICVLGEGEVTIVELIKVMEGKMDISDVKGVAYIEYDRIRHTGARPLIENLDMLPFPSIGLLKTYPEKYGIDLSLGIDSSLGRRPENKKDLVPMVSSRGCPYSCKFCQVKAKDIRWRARSPENLLEEIIQRIREFGINYFYFYEDNFTVDPERVKRFSNLLIEADLNIEWDCFSRADWITENQNAVRLMEKSGCRGIYMGVESLDKGIRYYNKGTTIKQVISATKLLKELGIGVTWSFVFGSLVDTRESLSETIEFFCNENPDFVQLFMLCPFPNTELFEEVTLQGFIAERDWDKYDAQHPILEYRSGISMREVQLLRDEAYLKFYERFSWCYSYLQKMSENANEIFTGTKAARLRFKIRRELPKLLPSFAKKDEIS